MTKEVSSLHDFPQSAIAPGRRMGNTTRAIDHAVQLLFMGHRVRIEDPWEWGGHDNANKDMFRRVLNRMNREHAPIDIKFDSKKLTIELITPSNTDQK